MSNYLIPLEVEVENTLRVRQGEWDAVLSTSRPRPDSEDTEYIKRRATDILTRLRTISRIYIAVLFWLLALNVSAIFFSNLNYTYATEYFIYYSGLVLLNVVVGIIAKLARWRFRLAPRVVYCINVTYIFITLVLSAFISLVDLTNSGHATAFFVSLFICSSFLLTSSGEILLAILLPTGILLFGLAFSVDSRELLVKFYQEVAAYIPIAFAISRVHYKAHYENYQKGVRLEQEIATNKMLNRRLKRANRRLEELALIDELTGLANRRGLSVYIDNLLREKGGNFLFAVIMLDIDHFKDYNDYYGHSSGDEVLVEVARVLREVANQTEGFVCRWGGEEFLYVTTGKNREGILDICKFIDDKIVQEKIAHPLSPISEYISLSQGASSALVKSRSEILGVIQQADRALYKVKRSGRNNYIYIPYLGESTG